MMFTTRYARDTESTEKGDMIYVVKKRISSPQENPRKHGGSAPSPPPAGESQGEGRKARMTESDGMVHFS